MDTFLRSEPRAPRLPGALLLAVALAGTLPGTLAAQAAPASFTAQQAEAGAGTYAAQCAACHGADLAGTPAAPPLSGAGFAGGWGGTPVAGLVAFVRDNMPMSSPGSLDGEAAAAVVAYVLSKNGMNPGQTRLAANAPGTIVLPGR